MKRVVHIAIDHAPLDVRVFQKEARTLASAGYDVHIITNYTAFRTCGGITIHRLQADARLGIRAAADGRIPRRVRRLWAAFRLARELRADAYHLHEPLLIPLGVLLKLRKAAVVYDAHEDYEHVASRFMSRGRLSMWLRRGSYRLLGWLASRCFDAVVSATPGIQRRFTHARSVLVRNYPLLDELTPSAGAPYAGRPAAVAYVGGISRARGIIEMLEAVDHVAKGRRIVMNLAGAFMPESLEQDAVCSPGWSHVRYSGWLDREGIRELLASSRIGLLVLHPDPNHVDSLPVKLFEYMAAGLPVIASDFPLWREIVDGAGCGLMVDPTNAEAIASAVEFLLDHPCEAEAMGRRGQAAIAVTYNWEGEAQTLSTLYSELVL